MDLGTFNIFNIRPGFGFVIGDMVCDVKEVKRDAHNIPISYKVSDGKETWETAPEDVRESNILVVVPPSYYRARQPALYCPAYFDAVAARHEALSKLSAGDLVGQPFNSSATEGFLHEPTQNLVFGPYVGHRFTLDNGTVEIEAANLFEASKGTRYGVKKLSGPFGKEHALGLIARHVPCNVYKSEIEAGIGFPKSFITGDAVLKNLYEMGFTDEELQAVGAISKPVKI